MLNGMVTEKELSEVIGLNTTLELGRKILESCDSVYGNKILKAAMEYYTENRGGEILQVIGTKKDYAGLYALSVKDVRGYDAVVFLVYKTNTELSAALGDSCIYQITPLVFNQIIPIDKGDDRILKALGY